MRRVKGGLNRVSDEMSLQITSMADIFTIILVFLLKSYSSSAVQLSSSNGIQIPEGSTPVPAVEAVRVEITESAIQVENKPVQSLSKFTLPAAMDTGPVRRALETEKKRQLFIAQSNPDVAVDSKILIVADQRTPYVTLKAVLASAAASGYDDFKFVVVRKD